MSLSIQQYIDMVRSVHPAFSRYMVPDKALTDFASREQQRLMSLAIMRDRTYLSQSMSILFDLNSADLDAPGVAGIGTAGAVPAVASGASFAASQATAGSAVGFSDGTISVADTPVASASSTTLTAVGVTWTVNAYVAKLARIVAGTGAGTSPRTIASNTSAQLTVSSAWEVTPDATSVFRIVAGVQSVDSTLGAVTDLPSVSSTRGYLVKLNASGVPYIDYTAPLVGHISQGVPLPSYYAVLGGTIRFSSALGAPFASQQADYGATPLLLVPEGMRFGVPSFAGYLKNSHLFLCGSRSDWLGVESIALHYVPVPPSFTARSDLFLLPDTALPVLTANGAVFAASRVTGIADCPQPPSDLLVAQATAAEDAWLSSISLSKRSRIGRVRPRG